MNLFKENQEVCLSIETLYGSKKELAFCKTVHGRSRCKGGILDCYDLYNSDGELACMDGENCRIDTLGESLIVFRNDNGDETIYFELMTEEAEIACFRDISTEADAYKVGELKKMLEHEKSETKEHYGANLKHWYGDAKPLTIDAGGIQCLIDYYKVHDTKL